MPKRPAPHLRQSGAKRLVFVRPDGGVSIDIPVRLVADNADALETHIGRMLAAHPGWQYVATIDQAELPPSRAKRNAWRWDGTKVTDQP